MKLLGMLAVFVFMLLGPFAMGIKLSAFLIEDERWKLVRPYKVSYYAALVSFLIILLVIIYFNYHRVDE